MSKLQEQVNTYTSNEGLRRQFMNFYRLVKTHSLLNSLFVNDAISSDVFNYEVNQTLKKINLIKQQLEAYDIPRFCQLWGIQTEYKNLGKMRDMMKSNIKVGIGVAKVANFLPRITDDAEGASIYQDIHESLSLFCAELQKMKETQQNITPSLKRSIDDLINLESTFSQKYKRLSDSLEESSKELLKQYLTKFRVEYQRAYRF